MPAPRLEVHGLLALMLLHHARRPSRTRADGSLDPLVALAAEQTVPPPRPGA